MIFFTKFLHNVNNPVLKALCKFQVDIPINARVTAVQNLENLHTYLYCGSHVGRQKNDHQTIFSYNITGNSPLLWSATLFSLVQINLNLIQRHIVWSCSSYKIWSKLIIICIIMFLIMSYANHQ